MIFRSKPHSIIAAAALLAGSHAFASSDAPWDSYVKRTGTDIAVDRYQAGTLGVVLPSYERAYLYTAWRDVILGQAGLKSAPNPQGGLADLLALRQGGWTGSAPGRDVYGAWRDAVAVALKREMSPPRDKDLVLESYLNCPAASYTFATATLT
ncbi:MAG TPA: hypothetical protein VN089_24390, partial [Duganella sp.]|nr:hypothetical protein [Duganella sp.]